MEVRRGRGRETAARRTRVCDGSRCRGIRRRRYRARALTPNIHILTPDTLKPRTQIRNLWALGASGCKSEARARAYRRERSRI